MIKLNKEAERKQQHMLELYQEQTLLKSQLAYTRNKREQLLKDLQGRQMQVASLDKGNLYLQQKTQQLRQKQTVLKQSFQKMTSQRSQLQSHLYNISVSKKRMQDELKSLQNNHASQQIQIQTFKAQFQLRDKHYESAEEGVLNYKGLIEKQKTKIGQIQKEISDIQTKIYAVSLP